ncbi:MAG: hypothetical protein ABSF82_11755 [Candidatus Bathyarchaeia archaeon]
MKVSATGIEATSEPTDKEFEGLLRDELKRYLQEKLGAMKTIKLDRTQSFDLKTVRLKMSEQITKPEFASVVAAYVSLLSQEKQARTNMMLEGMMLLLTGASVLILIVQLFGHR